MSASTASAGMARLRLLEPAQAILIALLVVGDRRVRGDRHELPLARPTPSRCVRLSVEIGLLAVALTPVIVSGGIDLSVGSLMGLSAVLFGKLWRDAGSADRRGGATDPGGRSLRGSLNGCLITRAADPRR